MSKDTDGYLRYEPIFEMKSRAAARRYDAQDDAAYDAHYNAYIEVRRAPSIRGDGAHGLAVSRQCKASEGHRALSYLDITIITSMALKRGIKELMHTDWTEQRLRLRGAYARHTICLHCILL
jgi:hypothetical protein